MSNDNGIRNIKALCERNETRDAYSKVNTNLGHAQELRREIEMLLHEEKEYEQLVQVLQALIVMNAKPSMTTESQKKATHDGAQQSFLELERKLTEMQHRISTIVVGINALRG